ncbi:glycosyltransferase family 4 protein [Clostridium sp. YIM B02555]|uniref:glycosyltransferase family 4 protein n=1 Tax=Clostridium sp. YIM B02555 TaxID=2911968 RepID=UPI001EEF7476|nr:glycosyltransferase family 4 protein [Clostridium sp. YIM B02555]
MKICFLTDTIFNLGGIQRVLSVLTNELVNTYDVTIICTNGTYKVNRELYKLDKKVQVIINEELCKKKLFTKIYSKVLRTLIMKIEFLNKKKFIGLLTQAFYPTNIQNNFINFFNSKDYDVIIGNQGYCSMLLGIIGNKINAKTIGWQHNSYDAYFNSPYKYNWKQDELFKVYIKKLDKYIVLTDDDKKLIDKNFMINSNRIYNPLSFTSDKKSNCEEKNIVCVGRLIQEQKGLDLLIKAFHKVSSIHKDWILYIVGDGADKDKLNELISDLNLENKIKIQPSTNNIEEYYLNSSILVSSSRWEGFGLVITEAMECGLPVIAFANSGPKEIINKPDENGILVPCEDIDALAENIIHLIENEEKRKRIAKGSIVRAQDFSISKISGEWTKIIQSLRA